MRRTLIAVTAFAALVGLVCAVATRSAAATPATAFEVDLAEWSIVPASGSVSAGLVRISASNLGTQAHQLVIVRTAAFAGSLPLRGDRALAHPLAPPLVIQPGGRRSLLLRLRRGSYLVLDNLPWHYWKGTWVAFSVR